MTDHAPFTQRFADAVTQDFVPMPTGYRLESIAADMRTAHASEYAAYQLGQISRKLDRLIEAIEKLAAK
jgi:hypothetical protein